MPTNTMKSTIETGIRLDPNRPILEYQELMADFNCRHVQILLTNSNELPDILEQVDKSFSSPVEISVYVPDWALLNTSAPSVVSTDNNTVKYVVSPLQVGGLGLPQSVAKSWSQLAEQERFFFCAEIEAEQYGHGDRFSDDFRDCWFTRLSYEYQPNLNIKTQLDQLAELRLRLGTIHFGEETPINDVFLKTHVGELAKHLFLMPYKQQPLIFTGVPAYLERSLSIFRETVSENRLWYL